MGSTKDFAGADRVAAQNFAAAAEENELGRIIYLGGLGAGDALSSHLSSRHETGAALTTGSTPVTELRAAVVIGSGSAGGILAKELSTAGFSTVVLEQGPYRKASDFTHDEYSVVIQSELHGGRNDVHGQTFRQFEHETAGATPDGMTPIRYARGVGGSSAHRP